MKNVFLKFVVGIFFLSATHLIAQKSSTATVEELNEVVVTATKFPIKKEHIGKIIEKISAAEIEKMPFQSVAKLLNEIAGIEINGIQSNDGKNLSYYVRGGRSHQLLVLIDGIPVTDPSGINFSYDLNMLSLNQVESIEIMKGAASTLYGSGAAAGVINITLKKATQDGFRGTAMFSVGTNQASNQKDYDINKTSQFVDVSGKSDKTSYLFSFSNVFADGMSEAFTENNTVLEADSFQQINAMAKLGHHFTDKFSVNGLGVFRKIKHDYDFAFKDSDKNYYNNDEFLVGINPVYKFNNIEFKGNVSFKSFNRNDTNEYGDSKFKSESITADIFNKVSLTPNWTLVSGIDYQYHNTDMDTSYEILKKDKAKFYMIDPYFTAVYQGKTGFNFNVGGRLNLHENYGNHAVYNVNPSYFIATSNFNLNLMGSISTAYVTPSLYQLYSSYGNLDLNPEESTTYELGYEMALIGQKITFNQTYFYREETNKIGFFTNPTTWVSNYYNQDGKQFFRGIENELAYKVSNQLNFKLNHTYTNLNENSSFLIPKIKWNASVAYNITYQSVVSLQYQYNGKRTAQDFRSWPATIKQLDSYQLVNLSYNTPIIHDRLHLFVDVNNLFNENFIENLGYATKGRNINIGLKFNF